MILDRMTDKPSCTGVFDNNYRIQLAEKALYLKPRGSVSSVTFRFGNASAEPVRLATELEQKGRVVIVDGADFQRLSQSTRLRAEILTVLNEVVFFDVDLSGFDESLANIRSGCPEGAPVPATSSTMPEQADRAEECSPAMRARMKAARLSATQIAKVCSSDTR